MNKPRTPEEVWEAAKLAADQGHDPDGIAPIAAYGELCRRAPNPLLPLVRELQAEVKRWKEQAFRPLGDNHHNAALCPYCSPAPNPLPSLVRELRDVLKNYCQPSEVEVGSPLHIRATSILVRADKVLAEPQEGKEELR